MSTECTIYYVGYDTDSRPFMRLIVIKYSTVSALPAAEVACFRLADRLLHRSMNCAHLPQILHPPP